MNAGARIYGMTYSALINGMNKGKILLNRKVMSDMAGTEPLSFKAVIDIVKAK